MSSTIYCGSDVNSNHIPGEEWVLMVRHNLSRTVINVNPDLCGRMPAPNNETATRAGNSSIKNDCYFRSEIHQPHHFRAGESAAVKSREIRGNSGRSLNRVSPRPAAGDATVTHDSRGQQNNSTEQSPSSKADGRSPGQ
jgi:hypothetical protein